MGRIDFYHLTKNTLDEALPKLAFKAYETGKKIKIKVGTEQRVDFINSLLWTFDEESFLPHGTKKEGNAELQPIYLSPDDENPNKATLLFAVDGANITPENTHNFERIFYIFDANNNQELQNARQTWKAFSSEEFERHYWKQDASGKWTEQKL